LGERWLQALQRSVEHQMNMRGHDEVIQIDIESLYTPNKRRQQRTLGVRSFPLDLCR
jgi:hypothetical protein